MRRASACRGAATGAALLIAGLAVAGCAAPELPGRPSGVRLLVIGLDGADWDRLEPMLRQRRLPHLAALVERGATGTLAAERPPLSPLLWTTVATARAPDAHGILDFVENDPDGSGAVPVTGRGRRVKAVWNHVSDAGLSAIVVGWWATWPAEEIRGVMISDRWSYTLAPLSAAMATAGSVFPPERAAPIHALRIAPEALPMSQLRRLLPWVGADLGDAVLHLRTVIASTRSVEAAALRLMAAERADLTMVYFEGLDEVGHRFARFEPPAMPGVTDEDAARFGSVIEEFTLLQDEIIGRLVAAAGPDTAVVVLSDHGFARGGERPPGEPAGLAGRAALWHVGPGILILAGGPFAATRLGEARLADITPTLLAALGLPVAEDFEGTPILSALRAEFLARHPVATIASWERVGGPVRRVAAPPAAGDDAAARIERLRSLGYLADGAAAERAAAGPTPAALLNLATVVAGKGQLAEAEAAYARALEAAPHSVLAHRGLFDLRVKAGQTDAALAAGRALLSLSPPPASESYAAVARLWAETGRSAEGRAFLRANPGEDGAAGPQLALGILAEADGRDRDAEVQYRSALFREPVSWQAAEALFRLFERQGRLSEAIPFLRHGLAACGGNSVPHLIALGYIALTGGDLDAAEDYLGRAVEDAPEEPEVQLYLGSVRYRTGRYLEAARSFDAVLRAEPGHREARANHILALGRAGRVAQALDSFTAAGPAAHDVPLLLNAAAYACLVNGLHEEGIPFAERSLRLAEDQPETRRMLDEMRTATRRPK